MLSFRILKYFLLIYLLYIFLKELIFLIFLIVFLIQMSKDKPGILDRPLSKGNQEFSVSFYNLLFAEIVSYCQDRANSLDDITTQLADLGRDVGWRIMDLLYHRWANTFCLKSKTISVRERKDKRDTKILDMLLFVKKTLWIKLFGKVNVVWLD